MKSNTVYPYFREVSEEEFRARCKRLDPPRPSAGKMLLSPIYLIASENTPLPNCICQCGYKMTRRNVIKHGSCRTNLVDYDLVTNRPFRCCILQQRWRCRKCNKTHITVPQFKHPRHEATKRTVKVVERFLSDPRYTYQEIAHRTGLDTKVVAEIDREMFILELQAQQRLAEEAASKASEIAAFEEHMRARREAKARAAAETAAATVAAGMPPAASDAPPEGDSPKPKTKSHSSGSTDATDSGCEDCSEEESSSGSGYSPRPVPSDEADADFFDDFDEDDFY